MPDLRVGEEEFEGGHVNRRAGALAACAALATALYAPSATADAEIDGAGSWRASLEYGNAPDARSARIALGRDGIARWRVADVPFSLSAEAVFGQWRVKGRYFAGRTNATQAGLVGSVRVGGDAGAFAELGTGPQWIWPHYQSSENGFSTAFNFGSHAGLGWRFEGAHALEVQVRYEHFSNGGYRRPNPGLNFAELRVGAAF